MDATDICNPVALERTVSAGDDLDSKMIPTVSAGDDLDSKMIPAVSAGDDLDIKMIASPSTSTFETPQDTANETWDIGDTW